MAVNEIRKLEPDLREWGVHRCPIDERALEATRAVLQYRRKAREDRQSVRPLLPYPVYVATMPDGRTVRMSFFTDAAKPINFARGYNVCLVVGRAKPTAGWVEYQGRRIEDPFWSGAEIGRVRVKRVTPAERLAALVAAVRAQDWQLAQQLAAV